MTHDNGGDAFPTRRYGLNPDGEPALFPGMTLHDYFMAHAPAEPQPWFIVSSKKRIPSAKEMISILVKERLLGDTMVSRCVDAMTESLKRKSLGPLDALLEMAPDMHRPINQCMQWVSDRMEEEKQRYIQWPAAWATAMIAQKRRLEKEEK